jgi:hypothetical protein
MIKFEIGKMYFRYNTKHEITYRLTLLSRWCANGETCVRYIIEHYNKGKAHLIDVDDYEVEVGETRVFYDSEIEVLYIKEFKIFIPADDVTVRIIPRYKRYIHKLITDIDFMREEVNNLQEYNNVHSVFSVIISKVVNCIDECVETVIMEHDTIDGVILLLTLANELMYDIEKSDSIHFEKSEVFLSCPRYTYISSQLNKFIVLDTLYEYLKESISSDTRNIIDNLIHTYLTLT